MDKAFLKFIMLILSIPVLWTGCISENEDEWSEVINYVNIGDKIPAFTITKEDGTSISTDDFKNKRSVIVLFTVTCGDCQRELPILNEAYEIMKGQAEFSDLLFVGLAREDTPEMTDKYWNDNNFSIPVYHDSDRAVFKLFANSTVPRVYVVNKDQQITWMGIERLNMTAEQLIQKIKDFN